MEIKDSFSVKADPARVWAYLLDIEQMGRCLPGVESVEATGENTYLGKLKVRVGPITASFDGKATLIELDPPQRLVAVIEGDDKSTGSAVKATFNSTLTPIEDGTQIAYAMEVTLRGRLAQFGLTVFRGMAKKMTAEFGKCIQQALAETVAP